MALMPVCSGSFTGCRFTMPGATRSTFLVPTASIGPLPSQRLAERVHDATQEVRAHRHLEHAAGAPDRVALLELQVVAHDDGADVVLFEVQRQGGDRLTGLGRLDLEHLVRHGRSETVDAGDSVLHLEDLADFLGLEVFLVVLDLLEQRLLDLAGAERCV